MFPELTDCGATGDPTKATREKGIMMKETLVSLLTVLDESGWDYRSPEVKERNLRGRSRNE